MSEETYAQKVQLKWRYTPDVSDIEKETDLAKAERTSDQYVMEYIAAIRKVTDLEHELADTRRMRDDYAYLFGAAKHRYLELKLAKT